MKRPALIDTLTSLNPTDMVYIGSNHGHGWIFMDTVENVLKDIDSMDYILKQKAGTMLDEAEFKLQTLPKKMVETIEKINAGEGEYDPEKREGVALESLLLDLQKAFSGAVKTRNQYKRILSNWVPLKNRKIVEQYKHETTPEGMSFIVEGYDRSEYCFYEELHGFEEKEVVA